MVELQSRLAPGPLAGSRRCLGGGPVGLYTWLSYVPLEGKRLQYRMKPRIDCAGRAPRLWTKCVVSPLQGSHGSKEQYSWLERTDARVGHPRERERCGCRVPGSHPGPSRYAAAVVSPTELHIAVPLAEGLRCKP